MTKIKPSTTGASRSDSDRTAMLVDDEASGRYFDNESPHPGLKYKRLSARVDASQVTAGRHVLL